MTSRTNLTINPQRLWDSLMETAAFGGTPKGGIKRLTVSDDDKRVRDWFKAECEKLGCTVEVDEALKKNAQSGDATGKNEPHERSALLHKFHHSAANLK